MAPTTKSSSSHSSSSISNAKSITSLPVVNTILRIADPIYALRQDLPDIKNAVNNAAKTVSKTVSKIGNPVYSSWGSTGSTGSSGSGAAVSGSGVSDPAAGYVVDSSGKVKFADANTQYTMDIINQMAQANNEWSAAQAQKQMDFQERLSSSAHQREVADLQAAGLNPVLSAGGNGASTPVGAMAQTDDSNTKLIAELAFAALEAMQQTATGVAFGAGSGSSKLSSSGSGLFGKLSSAYKSDKLTKKLVDTGLGVASKAAGAMAAKALISMI